LDESTANREEPICEGEPGAKERLGSFRNSTFMLIAKAELFGLPGCDRERHPPCLPHILAVFAAISCCSTTFPTSIDNKPLIGFVSQEWVVAGLYNII
jgi:hypothetical protein